METVSQDQPFITTMTNELFRYDGDNLIFNNLLAFCSDKNPFSEGLKIDLRVFRIGDFYYLYVYYYFSETKAEISPDMERFRSYLPDDFPFDRIYLFSVGQGGRSGRGLYLRTDHYNDVMTGLTQILIAHPEKFRRYDLFRTLDQIVGALVNSCNESIRQQVLELCLSNFN